MPHFFAQSGRRHARYIDPSVPYHIVNKTIRGAHLLKGDREVNAIIIGIMAQARENSSEVRLFGFTFMSNHFHMELQGPSQDVSEFVGFVKREISRRLGTRFREPGPYWHGRFKDTALPTPEAQEGCFKYILANSVKEHLVARCRDWIGAHCGEALATGKPLKGVWFDSSGYGTAKRSGKRPNRADYTHEKTLTLDRLDAWSDLSDEAYQAKVRELIEEVEHEASEVRRLSGKRVVGVRALRRMPRTTCTLPEPPGWYQDRKRCICAWVNPLSTAVKQFVANYYAFQNAFREASDLWRLDKPPPDFPVGSWAPARAIA